ncbi:MAG: porin family protein, partial [Candidatus Cloacimonetes bacterium]|nr:porin family protein [Candidatus Cloacimonadota bacterium]MCK9184146.1 porin family protein [Candidatus Cloacimonadota bacterium]
MFKKILILLFVCVSAHLAGMDKYNTAMGVHFGTSTGNGYSIRKWGNTNAYQLTFAAYTTGNRNSNHNPRKNSISLGANYLWGLHDSQRYKFYVLSGMAYTIRRVKEDGTWESDDRWAVGAGPGFEFEFSDRFHVSIELPMTYNYKDDITMYIPSGGFYY